MERKKRKMIAKYTCSVFSRFVAIVAWACTSISFILVTADYFSLFFLTALGIYTLETLTDIIIWDDGIELRTTWGTRFIKRSRLIRVQNTGLQLHIHVKGWVFFPRFVVMGWHSEYKEIYRTLNSYIKDTEA